MLRSCKRACGVCADTREDTNTGIIGTTTTSGREDRGNNNGGNFSLIAIQCICKLVLVTFHQLLRLYKPAALMQLPAIFSTILCYHLKLLMAHIEDTSKKLHVKETFVDTKGV